jgi:YD repeat-containing protein
MVTVSGSTYRYEYDQIGRLKQMGDMGTQQRTYDDDDPDDDPDHVHVHAVTTAASSSYDYDPNGNMVHSDPYDFDYVYNAENRLVSAPFNGWNDSSVYTYDGLGNLAKRDIYVYGQTLTTYYVGGIYELRFQNGAPMGNTKYYSAFGRRIAMRSNSSVSPLNQGYPYVISPVSQL